MSERDSGFSKTRLVALLAVVFLHVPAVVADERAALESQQAEVEALVIELQRQQVEIRTQIEALEHRYALRQFEIDQHGAELERLRAEAKALDLESRGRLDEADFVRRGAVLEQEERALTARLREISLREQELVEPLELERDEQSLRLRELGRAESAEEAREIEELKLEHRRLRHRISVMKLDLEIEEMDIRSEWARVDHRQMELRREMARFRGRAGEAERLDRLLLEQEQRRRSLDIDLVFAELKRELLAERIRLDEALQAAEPGSKRQNELSQRLRALGEDFNRLGRAQRTHRQEKELGHFQRSLSRHLDDLERAGRDAPRSEAEAIAAERERLRAAVQALIDASAS